MKYSVDYKRTGRWWQPGGDWYELSTWCNQNCGQRNWDYINERFIFKDGRHQMLFILKWL